MNYRACAATRELQTQGPWNERPWEKRQRHRGCGVTLGPQSEERGIYCLCLLAAMKNNCHAARREERSGREKWRERQIRQTEEGREVGGAYMRGLRRVCCDLCALLSWAVRSTGMMSNRRQRGLFFFPPSHSQKGNDSLVFGYLERGTTVQINMHGPICQYVISAGN